MSVQFNIERLRDHWASTGRVEDVTEFHPIERSLRFVLPADYKYFLMWPNGGETLTPLEHLRFYPLEELLLRQADGQPSQTLEIATNDSLGYAFDLSHGQHSASYPIVSYPLGDTTRDDAEVVAGEFNEFLAAVLSGRLLTLPRSHDQFTWEDSPRSRAVGTEGIA